MSKPVPAALYVFGRGGIRLDPYRLTALPAAAAQELHRLVRQQGDALVAQQEGISDLRAPP